MCKLIVGGRARLVCSTHLSDLEIPEYLPQRLQNAHMRECGERERERQINTGSF